MKTRKTYVPRTNYSPADLIRLRISDLEIDVACAERDGYPAYADECRDEIHHIRGERLAPVDFGFVFGPEPVEVRS